MSYDIFYNRQFVRLRKTGEVIPMLLAGSNNCYEIGYRGRNGRRVRSWESDRYYNRKGKISEKPEVILKKLDAELRRVIRDHRGRDEATPKDIRKHWGYYVAIVVGSGHCAGTSWDKYRGMYANGIKSAMTIEQLADLNVNLIFQAGYGSENSYPASVPLKTESEYFAELKKWREWQALGKRSFHMDFIPSNTDSVLDRLRGSRRRMAKKKERVEQDHYFILTDGHDALVKYTRRGFQYSFGKTGGKRHRTEKDAEKYRRQLVANERHKADIWKVERIERLATFWV